MVAELDRFAIARYRYRFRAEEDMRLPECYRRSYHAVRTG